MAAVVIVARNNDTGFTRSASTNAFGSYRIDDLLPGAYTVTAQHDGFQAVTVSPVFVEVNQKVRLDVELKVGSVHDTATVTAHASPLQTDEASEGYTLGSNFFEELPLLGRNIVDLVTLGPGAIPRQLGGFTHDHHQRSARQSRRRGVQRTGERRAIHREQLHPGRRRQHRPEYILDRGHAVDGVCRRVPDSELARSGRVRASRAAV